MSLLTQSPRGMALFGDSRGRPGSGGGGMRLISPATRLNRQQAGARQSSAFVHARPNYWEPPRNAAPIEKSSQPFVAYPAPGAPAITVLSYTVPNGYRGAIRWIAIVAVGGGFIDGTGNVVWRIQRNAQWVQGYEMLTAQIGSWAEPNPAPLEVQENETYTVTVEVPTGMPPQSGTTGARFRGWLQPLNQIAAMNGA
jgi:hypothetical protein